MHALGDPRRPGGKRVLRADRLRSSGSSRGQLTRTTSSVRGPCTPSTRLQLDVAGRRRAADPGQRPVRVEPGDRLGHGLDDLVGPDDAEVVVGHERDHPRPWSGDGVERRSCRSRRPRPRRRSRRRRARRCRPRSGRRRPPRRAGPRADRAARRSAPCRGRTARRTRCRRAASGAAADRGLVVDQPVHQQVEPRRPGPGRRPAGTPAAPRGAAGRSASARRIRPSTSSRALLTAALRPRGRWPCSPVRCRRRPRRIHAGPRATRSTAPDLRHPGPATSDRDTSRRTAGRCSGLRGCGSTSRGSPRPAARGRSRLAVQPDSGGGSARIRPRRPPSRRPARDADSAAAQRRGDPIAYATERMTARSAAGCGACERRCTSIVGMSMATGQTS